MSDVKSSKFKNYIIIYKGDFPKQLKFIYNEKKPKNYLMLTPLDLMIVGCLEDKLSKEDEDYFYVFDILTKKHFKLLSITNTSKRKKYTLFDGKSITSGFRSEKIDSLKVKLNKEYYTFFHEVFGIFKNAKRNYSDSLPLVSLNFKFFGEQLDSHGRAYQLSTATTLAVIEGLERIHGAVPLQQNSFKASQNELELKSNNLIRIQDFIHEDNQYYPFPIYKDNIQINWTIGKSLINEERIYIPEQIAYYGNMEKRYLESTSNGVSVGSNSVEAIISSILELVERDAFLVHWYTKTPPEKITSLHEANNKIINNISNLMYLNDYKLHFFNITTEVEIPTVWVLFEYVGNDYKNNIAFYTAASSDIYLEKALESALIEGSSSLKALLAYLQFTNLSIKKDQRNIKTLEDHILYYSNTSNKEAFQFALDSKKKINFNKLNDSLNNYKKYKNQNNLLKAMINKLSIYHKNIWYVDLSSEFLKNFNLSATKVIIPSMQNIHFGYYNKNINKKRLSQFLNDVDKVVLNNDIHPFP